MNEGRRQPETNLIGPARLIQLCLPYMRAQRYGRNFSISSIGGKLATPLGGWYHASARHQRFKERKAALGGLDAQRANPTYSGSNFRLR